MDINQAVATIEEFLARYGKAHADQAPVEAKVNPSGDQKDAIKLWLNFGAAAEGKEAALAKTLEAALLEAHPDLKAFTLAVRAQAF
jgi:hypothetical protein